MSELSEKRCEPCQGGVEPLEGDKINPYLEQLDSDWEVVDEHHLRREFDFEDFQEALDFVNRVGKIAEEEGHHPNIEFTWGEATVKIYTHKIDGLHENDFILASKIDEIISG
ncbi:MAG: 4a-hydroxytetrahydrobiopterin dehydratase [Candidatus Nanohaloarchaea archaeon]